MDYEKTKQYKETKADLLTRFGDRATGSYASLIDTYMRCWVEARMFEDDVKKRGIYYEYENSAGVKGTKKNESVGEKLKVIAQMLKILDALDIKPTGQAIAEDEL